MPIATKFSRHEAAEFKSELENKINMLRQSNSTESKKELNLLNEINNYIK